MKKKSFSAFLPDGVSKSDLKVADFENDAILCLPEHVNHHRVEDRCRLGVVFRKPIIITFIQ